MTEAQSLLQEFLKQLGITDFHQSGEHDYSCCCPFHEDEKPSFSISFAEDKWGVWYCFACQVRGDFLALKNQLGKDLAIHPYQPTLAQQVQEKLRSQEVKAVELPEQSLYGVKKATEYLCKYRGYEEDMASVLVPLYGLYQGSGAWKNYLILPVRNAAGTVIGYTSRNLTAVGPKTKHATGLNKDEWLWGIDVALEQFGRQEVLVTEGPFDALRLYAYGYPAIAVLGPPTTAQLLLLRNVFRNIYTMFDGDLSGRKYQKKVQEVMAARHFQLPYGKDPDDLTEKQVRFVLRHKQEKSLTEITLRLLGEV